MALAQPTRTGLHPDRALPSGTVERGIAREILGHTRDLPIVSMHGHVPVALLEADQPFGDPASLLVVPDHYLVRMLLSQGVAPESLGLHRPDGTTAAVDPREVWRAFASRWHLFRGTPTRFWLEHVFAETLGVEWRLSADNADRVFDDISARLAEPDFLPLALLDRWGIEVLATTDAADADLSSHHRLAERGYTDRIVPTFRPDAVLRLDRTDWADSLALLGQRTGSEIGGYADFVAALEQRRWAFVEAGARATDHGHASADTTPLDGSEAERIFAAALRGEVTAPQADAFAAHMLFEMARMSTHDGLVMQLHPGVLRDHDPRTQESWGSDIGYDIPVSTEFTRSLRPLLNAFGHHPDFTLVLFTVDETTYSRELAPLAGVYPAVRLGAPWWFLDSPDGMRRFREAAVDTAGFFNTAGFVDDTRAFLSIPARHDLARRMDAGHLARLVAEHRLELDEAVETAVALAHDLPRAVYPTLPRGASSA
ncbi:glucuronate isomerase [Nocardioides sp. BP30]|uniref:glucuronate isomerase n=1 Tax=Nocardioides sp. BP30 TaxID=3036374 RepID=UPI002468B240|nr:glucuronate isomerase [Nocardioides sp. BP30]WGL51094.1 glucuronate isomerase [Nocardioides sp. BP30]